MIVFLTGGIGVGKSTVLRFFADLGARTISADDIVRDLYGKPTVQSAIAEALSIGLPLDRRSIAEVVFADADARARLEAVIHPLVSAHVDGLRQGPGPLVYEIPLPPQPRTGDHVILVTASDPARLTRLMARGMDRADAVARMAAQPPIAVYGKDADVTIVNEGDVAALRDRVSRVWRELQDDSGAV